MAKKKFDTQSFTAKFFSASEEEQPFEDKIEESPEPEQMQTEVSAIPEENDETKAEQKEENTPPAVYEGECDYINTNTADSDLPASATEVVTEESDYMDKTEDVALEPDEIENAAENQSEEDLREVTQISERRGRPPKMEAEKIRKTKLPLGIDNDLVAFLDNIIWVKRVNKTQYINDLIRADKERYEAENSNRK